MKRKASKRVLSALFALVMAFSLVVPSFADSPDDDPQTTPPVTTEAADETGASEGDPAQTPPPPQRA